MRRLPEWLDSRNLRLLVVCRTSMSIARSLASVVVPIYLAKLGYGALDLGLLFGVTAIASGVLTASVGLLADRWGCKPFLLVFPLLTAISGVVYLLTRNFALIVAFSAIGTVGRGGGAGAGGVGPYQPAEASLIAASVPARHRSSAFGLVAFSSTIGALAGGLLASIPDIGHLLGVRGLAAYDPAFVALIALCLLTSVLAIPLVEVRRTAPPAGTKRSMIRLPRQSMPFLLRLMVTNSVNGFAVGAFAPFITYWFYIRYGAGPGEVGLLYAVINVASAAPNLFAGRIAARFGLVRTVSLSRVVSALLLFVMAVMPAFLLAGAVYLVRMAAQRVSLPLRQSYVMGIVPDEERASVAGLSNLPSQVTSAVTPPIGGYLFDHVALALPFVLGGVLQLLNAGLYYLFFRNLLPPEEKTVVETIGRDEPAEPVPTEH